MAPEPRLEPVPGWRFGEPQQPSVREKVRLGIFHALRRAGVQVTVQARWHFGAVVDVTVPSDFGRCLWVAGCFEPNETAFLASVLQPGMTFIDVGANIGLYTLLAAHLVAAEGTLVAVEPSPRTGSLVAISPSTTSYLYECAPRRLDAVGRHCNSSCRRRCPRRPEHLW